MMFSDTLQNPMLPTMPPCPEGFHVVLQMWKAFQVVLQMDMHGIHWKVRVSMFSSHLHCFYCILGHRLVPALHNSCGFTCNTIFWSLNWLPAKLVGANMLHLLLWTLSSRSICRVSELAHTWTLPWAFLNRDPNLNNNSQLPLTGSSAPPCALAHVFCCFSSKNATSWRALP